MSDRQDLAAQERASASVTRLFVELTPDRVLKAVEAAGLEPTGLCYPLNSFENRVYEIELVDRSRLVSKFYRPGRWTRSQIIEEHRLLQSLVEEEIPACPPRLFPNGSTLAEIDGIYYALWNRQGGRAPDELSPSNAARLGRLVARIHNVAAPFPTRDRPTLDADRYIRQPVLWMQEEGFIPDGPRPRYLAAALAIADIYEERSRLVPQHLVHADLHLGNLLFRNELLWILDFDDMAVGPAVQDLWLALPGRDSETLRLRDRLLTAYEELRSFDHSTLDLVEPLRGLRMVRYTGWLARRWHDPAFKAGWPEFGSRDYWREATEDLEAQLEVLQTGSRSLASPPGGIAREESPRDIEELTNKDYFWDWEE